MKTRYKYEQLLTITVDNALLHLWIHVAQSKRFVPTSTRNQVLINWIKPKIKNAQFKLVKNDLKSMIKVAREGANLEERLCELRALSLDYQSKLTDMHKLHYLLEHLRVEHDVHSEQLEVIEAYTPNTMYIAQKEIEESFSESNEQITPIKGLYTGDDIETLIQRIEAFGEHSVERLGHQVDGCYTFELTAHPSSNSARLAC
ncbi:DUF2913 family protein [Vibrio sp. HN007]|uniref:DUF2913 family protein n=1 Tax=Vibrio iocasae TaxID=3098914 RepID=UPI0035D4825F